MFDSRQDRNAKAKESQFSELQFLRRRAEAAEAEVKKLKAGGVPVTETQGPVVVKKPEPPAFRAVLVRLLAAVENQHLDKDGKFTAGTGGDLQKAMKEAAAIIRPVKQ